ncbi:MAG: SMC family ATPase [bacterium]
MRPLRLKIEGFTAFKEPQEIDFSDIDLFAIAGPTGAGKTSILDAMQWALFGKVPRMSQNVGDLISLGSDTASVTFEFSLQGVQYQVSRVMRRNRNGNAQLDELEPTRSLAAGINNVNAEVIKLIGLQADTFAMSVVLPQGKFARYFEASPAERRALLREIYNLNFFEEMRSRAWNESQELARRVSVLEQSMGDLSATPEALEAVLAELTSSEERRAQLQVEREVASAKFHELQEVMRLLEKRVVLESQLAEFATSEAVMQGKRDSLQWNRKAQVVWPKAEEFTRAQTTCAEVTKRLDVACKEQESLASARSDLLKKMEVCDAEMQTIASMETRVAQLNQLQKLIADYEARQEKLDEVERDLLAWSTSRKVKSDALLKREEELSSASEFVGELEQKIQQLTPNVKRLAFLDSLKNAAEDWQVIIQKDLESKGRLDALEREAAQLREEHEQREKQRADADEAAANARADANRLAAELEHARTRDMASALRAHVHVGQACPVCEQVVQSMPTTSPLDLGALTDAAAAAAQLERELVATTVKHEAALGQLQARLNVVVSQMEELAVAQAQRRNDAVQRSADYLAQFGERAEDFERFQSEWSQARADAELAQKLSTDLENRKTRVLELRASIADLQSELKESRARGSELEERRTAAAAARDAAQQVLPQERVESPLHEVQTLQSEIERIRKSRQEVAEAIAANAARIESFAVAIVALQQDQTRAEMAREAAREDLERLMHEHGFQGEQELRSRLLTPSQVDEFERELKAFDGAKEGAARELQSVDNDIRGRTATALDLEAARATKHGLDQAYEELLGRIGELKSQRGYLTAELAKIAEQTQELETTRRRSQTMSALADDLRTNNFQNYVFQDLFSELVVGASERLLRLSQRYALEVDSDAKFFVVDQDNAGERRSIETLSGGETFLASLALALQLSQQVQDAAGALSLDSLFIDEGFGTLDPETLETVAEAVEALRDTGRVVGIITHIAELTNRLPVRLRVNKSVEGSQVVIERD